ncbi:MAG: phosphonate metabolism protein PhnP [Litorivicinaceae bacterium]|jgi:phosphoribosyl 1,2-cyclic phosphate phosphodiesterase|nr:phosphonate metabolism protein PhnP [Litorivicinaceae bacterium]
MLIRLLGTGNAAQIPVFGCDCRVCARARVDERYRRRPSSAEIVTSMGRYLLDAGRTDLAQWLDPSVLRGVILTHYHMDHVEGLFHLRWGPLAPIPVYGPPDETGADDLFTHPGCFDFSHQLTPYEPTVISQELTVTPIPLKHSRLCFGYVLEGRRESVAYLSDCDGVGPRSLDTLQRAKPKAVIVDCTYPPGMGRNHFSLDRALEFAATLAAPRVYLTHIGHVLEQHLIDHPLPLEGPVSVASDGMTLSVE